MPLTPGHGLVSVGLHSETTVKAATSLRACVPRENSRSPGGETPRAMRLSPIYHDKPVIHHKFRAMFPARFKGLRETNYPVQCAPLFEGVRCLTIPVVGSERCQPVSHRMRPIYNEHIWRQLAWSVPPGLDGRIVIHDQPDIQLVIRDVCRIIGKPVFTYYVYDYIPTFERDPLWYRGVIMARRERYELLTNIAMGFPDYVKLAPMVPLTSLGAIEYNHQANLTLGHPGSFLWTAHSPYKYGRCTPRENWHYEVRGPHAF